jgi:Nucleotidyltransferase domain.
MKRLTPYEETVIRSYIEYFSSFTMIGSIVLYGSRSKGISNEYSDVDIAVVVDEATHVKEIEKKLINGIFLNLQKY